MRPRFWRGGRSGFAGRALGPTPATRPTPSAEIGGAAEGSGCVSSQSAGGDGRIDAGLAPASGFIATAMHRAMVPATQRDGELVADLTAERAALRKAQMMGVRRLSATD
jgi:hypothetical protein